MANHQHAAFSGDGSHRVERLCSVEVAGQRRVHG
jgi:hypothetical protein